MDFQKRTALCNSLFSMCSCPVFCFMCRTSNTSARNTSRPSGLRWKFPWQKQLAFPIINIKSQLFISNVLFPKILQFNKLFPNQCICISIPFIHAIEICRFIHPIMNSVCNATAAVSCSNHLNLRNCGNFK